MARRPAVTPARSGAASASRRRRTTDSRADGLISRSFTANASDESDGRPSRLQEQVGRSRTRRTGVSIRPPAPVRRVWRSRLHEQVQRRRVPWLGLMYVCPSVCLFQFHLSVVNAARLDAGPLIIIMCCNQWASSRLDAGPLIIIMCSESVLRCRTSTASINHSLILISNEPSFDHHGGEHPLAVNHPDGVPYWRSALLTAYPITNTTGLNLVSNWWVTYLLIFCLLWSMFISVLLVILRESNGGRRCSRWV